MCTRGNFYSGVGVFRQCKTIQTGYRLPGKEAGEHTDRCLEGAVSAPTERYFTIAFSDTTVSP